MDEIVPDASDPAMTQAIEANIAAFYAHMGRARGAELHSEPDLTWFKTGVPSASFNGVIQTWLAPTIAPAEVGARIDAMISTFAAQGLPMIWWVTPSTSPPDLATYLTARGFESIGARPGMALDLTTAALPARIPPIAGVEITAVNDKSSYEQWVRVFSASYGHQPDAAQRYLALTAPLVEGDDTDVRHYLARLDGSPVAISTLIQRGDVAGLYHVGTVPDARGRGIGTAIVQAPLLEARSLGLRHAVLYSSPLGLNIYRKLGFKTYCRLDRYVLAPR